MIMEANHCIYMENQFFITNTESGKGPVQNLIGRALVQRILSAARSGTKFKVRSSWIVSCFNVVLILNAGR